MKHALSSLEFRSIYPKAKSLIIGDLLFRYRKTDCPKIGFIVSRKYGNAYHRALFKRRCRSLFEKYRSLGSCWTIILRPNKTKITFSDVENSFKVFYENLK
ncbi:MAG: ribonuclease P protein component [Candidatus Marinimicrobia bacterium]|nr:ribonuclease P protein component [Candidatus Neomarinimicrobiota bacterium]MBL7023313.1 ribonuclease P protein component [Candidatus Neomarinimicrobiota bacterium]